MRQVLCPVLVGREEEVQVLLDGLDRAADARGGVFFVIGEAGVGKSRLVREVSQAAAARGLPVMTGRAVPGEVPVPFRPLAEAVLGGLRRSGPQDLAELRSIRPALGRLVPEWLPREPVQGMESPVVLGEGLLRLLRVLDRERGCLLVLEDLHWADRESLAVVEYLADNVATERIVCLATVRAEEGGAGGDLAATLVARRAARAVELGRLDDEATVRLARACLSTPVLPAAVEAFLGAGADGLPFLVEELLAGLVAGGVLVEHDGRWTTRGPLDRRIPPTFADAVRRRLAGLSPPARGVLHAAALLGRRFDWSLLPAVTDLDDTEVVAALRQAVDAQLLTAEVDGFQFRHALTRDAVLGDLVAPQRASLAGRTLAAVERAHPDLAGVWCELAAELAETAGDRPRAAQLWLTAGLRAATAGALVTAEETLRRARRLVPDDPVRTVPIDVALTDVLAQAGQVDRAFELGERLLARLDLTSRLPAGGGELHLRLARAGIAAGRWQVAEDHLSAARAAPAVDQPGLAALIDALDAQVALGQGRLSGADRLAAAALAAAAGGHGLYSTPGDYLRFQRMLLGGGTLAGARILGRSSVREAFTNQIGDLWFPAEIRTADPVSSCDYLAGAGMKWGWGLLLNTDAQPAMRSAGSGGWAGMFNTYFWVDPAAKITGAVYTQSRPFLDPGALRTYADFERALYAAYQARF